MPNIFHSSAVKSIYNPPFKGIYSLVSSCMEELKNTGAKKIQKNVLVGAGLIW